MANLYWLDQIQPTDHALVGNKAYYLSRLLQQGYPVIPGFVISAQLLHQFLEAIDWLEPLFADLPHSSLYLDIENSRQIQAVARQIRRALEIPTLQAGWTAELAAGLQQLNASVVALRPSLVLAGEPTPYDPVTNDKSSALFNIQVCQADLTEVTAGLKQVWIELFSAKSLFYWQRSQIPLQQVNLAVLVQPVWSAISSGTVQATEQQLQIQAAPGLGMGIAWGEVIPDRYQVDRLSGNLQTYQLGKKTIAYQPTSPCLTAPAASSPATDSSFRQPVLAPPNCRTALQVQMLAETAASTDSLPPQELTRLVQLLQQLTRDFGHPLELEWMLTEDDAAPTIYFTQLAFPPRLRPENFVPPPQVAAAVPSRPVLQGLGGAPGQAIARAQVVRPLDEVPSFLPPNTVLVVNSLPPYWLPLLKQATAIVAEQGGLTSHSAIMARELGIPAVVSMPGACEQIHTGDLLEVDGDRGSVIRLEPDAREQTSDHPVAASLLGPPVPSGPRPPTPSPSQKWQATVLNQIVEPVSSENSRPPIGTGLLVNLSQPESLTHLNNLPIDGIGLLRSELMVLSLLDGHHPLSWLDQGKGAELAQRLALQIGQFAAALAPRPVLYRSLDLRSHEFQGLGGQPQTVVETNPMLGVRGTFSYLLNPGLFDLELQALAQAQQMGYQNLSLMLPFVRTIEEFRFCRLRVEQAGLTQVPQFRLWIMAEVPSVLFLLPDYVKAGVQGISIGSNDLTQLLLGVDREQGALADVFDERHPAVKAAIAHLIQQAIQADIPCSICGQAPAQYPELIEDLIRWGITSISVDPEAVERTYWAIARAERRLLIKIARQQ